MTQIVPMGGSAGRPFALLSYLQTPPALWFAVAVFGIGAYMATRDELTRVPIAIFGAVLVALIILGQNILWSPYHRLETQGLHLEREDDHEPVNVGYTLKVQQVFYQVAIDLSDDFLAELQGVIPVMEDAADANE